jgi:hypothetical protein
MFTLMQESKKFVILVCILVSYIRIYFIVLLSWHLRCERTFYFLTELTCNQQEAYKKRVHTQIHLAIFSDVLRIQEVACINKISFIRGEYPWLLQ